MNEYLKSLIENINHNATQMDMAGFVISIVFSLFGSIIVVAMYGFLYDKKCTGSGIDKSFMMIGPSVTVLLVAIQYSLPLSLGLLGALSFIRFRTPIRDAEEIAYLLLLVSYSITCATSNYLLGGILLGVVLISLITLKHVLPGRWFMREQGHFFISFESNRVASTEIINRIEKALPSGKLKNWAVHEDATSFHFSFGDIKPDMDKLHEQLQALGKIQQFNIVMDKNTL